MEKKNIQININDFPSELRFALTGANIYDSSCHSNAEVLYSDHGYYIKIDGRGELKEEAALTELFSMRGMGAEFIKYVCADRDYLVTREVTGEDMTHYSDEPERLCEILAAALRELHERPLSGVPVSFRQRRYLESATGDFSRGYYDEGVLTKRFPIGSKQEAWEIMQANKHRLKCDTLIHGDACLPNLIMENGRFKSFIDFSLAGSGDRHIDLYWAIWSLQYNLGTEEYTDRFLDAYGREYVDEEMLQVVAAFELFG
ncbi:MAG: phosphotransferase [Lachnospiraceae bacterium]|nr:phosphotransferase [Lachnospiraceae bacterium]